MKRRSFLSGISIGAIGGTAGCIDIPSGIVSDDPNSISNGDKPPREELYLGSGEQISLRIFDVNREYNTIEDTAYVYNGEPYSLEEFGTIVASEDLVNKVRRNLSGKDILPDPRITLSPSEFILSEVKNPSVRENITIQRNLERGVVVEYVVETESGKVTSEPQVEIEDLVNQTPSSGTGTIQFDKRAYTFTIPIGVKVVVI